MKSSGAPARAANSLDRAAAGACLAELFARHRATVLGLCRVLLRDRQEAEDAAQQTFLSAYRSLLGGTEPRHPAAWLATIARNECWGRIQRRMREPLPSIEADGDVPDPVVAAASRADLGELWRAIGELPDKQKEALLLREFSGLSYSELATALAVSEPAVESLLFRARQALRVRLQPAYGLVASFAPLAAIRLALRRAVSNAPDLSGAGGIGRIAAAPAVAKVAAGAAAIVAAGGAVAVVEQDYPARRHPGPAPAAAILAQPGRLDVAAVELRAPARPKHPKAAGVKAVAVKTASVETATVETATVETVPTRGAASGRTVRVLASGQPVARRLPRAAPAPVSLGGSSRGEPAEAAPSGAPVAQPEPVDPAPPTSAGTSAPGSAPADDGEHTGRDASAGDSRDAVYRDLQHTRARESGSETGHGDSSSDGSGDEGASSDTGWGSCSESSGDGESSGDTASSEDTASQSDDSTSSDGTGSGDSGGDGHTGHHGDWSSSEGGD